VKKYLPHFVFTAMALLVAWVLWQTWRKPTQWTPERLAATPLHYRLYWDGVAIGHHDQTLEALPDGSWQWHSHHELNAKVRDATVHETVDEVFIFDGKYPYRLRDGEVRRNDDMYTLQNRSEFTVHKGDAIIVTEATLNFGLADLLYSMQSIADGPQAGASLTWKQFDAHNFRVLTLSIDVLGQQQHDGLDLWQLAISSPEQTYRSEMWVRRDGVMQRLSNGAIEMRWSDGDENADKATAENVTRDLYQVQTIPIDRALGDAKKIAGLALRWSQHIALPLQTRADQYVQAGFVRTEIAANPVALAGEQVEALLPEARYSGDDAHFLQRTKALTQSLLGDEQRVRGLLLFVSEHLKQGTELRELTANEILRNQRGDCTEYAQLFVALARASGLPAREVSGLVYLGDTQLSFGGHTWAEVAINGRWQSVDPMWNLYGVTATHLRMGEGEQGAMATLVHDARLRFDVDQIRYKQ